MFGEKEILGQWSTTIDDKGRMIVPFQTGAEYGDELILLRKYDYFELLKREELLNRLDVLREQNIEYKELDRLLDEYYMRILTTNKLDKQRRFITGGNMEKGQYKVIGARKSIYLMKPEQYEKRLKNN